MSIGSATELDGLATAGALAVEPFGDGPLVVTVARPYLLRPRTSPAQA